MLLGIPKILSPELLKVLSRMGHSDVIVLGDANFPVGMFERQPGLNMLRADGHGISELLDAILQVIPLDKHIEKPVMLMDKMEQDKEIEIPVWDEYAEIIATYDERGSDAIGYYERFEFYEQAKKACCVLHTGEESIYANVLLQKGVIAP